MSYKYINAIFIKYNFIVQLGFNPQKILYFYTFSMGARNMLTFMISRLH